MASEPIPFGNAQASGHEQLAGASPASLNTVVDANGCVWRRPGIAAPTGFYASVVDEDGIVGLHMTASGSLIAVAAAEANEPAVYVVSGVAAGELAYVSGGTAAGAGRPVFAETEALVLLTAGGEVKKIEADLPMSVLPLGGGPPDATHVIANGSRVLVNRTDGSGNRLDYSGQAAGSSTTGHEEWDLAGDSGFFSADARPDRVVALYENTNEVFAFGKTTLQVFAPDTQTVYSPVTTLEVGCAAPHSVIKVDQKFAWLDDKRRLVVSDGRQTDVLSGPIQRSLDDMATVSGAFGYRVKMGPLDCLCWRFPDDGRTLAYQQGGGWSTWMSYDESNSVPIPLKVGAHLQVPGSGANLIGSTNGQLGQFSFATETDFGNRINAYTVTGFISRGTERKKWCRSVRLALQRGVRSSDAQGYIDLGVGLGKIGAASLSWRDDLGPWEPDVEIALEPSGDFETVVQLDSLGAYRRRQWRFTFSSINALRLVSAVEDFEVLEA